MKYKAICICNKGYENKLTIGKEYNDFCSNEDGYRESYWVTTIDDDGDDESYPSELFGREGIE